MTRLTGSLTRVGFAAAFALVIVAANTPASEAQPTGYRYVNIGGVNLNYYCAKDLWRRVQVGSHRQDCRRLDLQQSPGNRRPISVENACKLQYGNSVKQAKALDWNDPGSWVCVL